jgi:hypothetical protein
MERRLAAGCLGGRRRVAATVLGETVEGEVGLRLRERRV